MCYVVFVGGKCFCLVLFVVIGEWFGVFCEDFLFLVFVLEFIYIFSLVYDDLLVFDDDDLWCGCFMVYVVYDEVFVVFVGDVFFGFGFEVLMYFLVV